MEHKPQTLTTHGIVIDDSGRERVVTVDWVPLDEYNRVVKALEQAVKLASIRQAWVVPANWAGVLETEEGWGRVQDFPELAAYLKERDET